MCFAFYLNGKNFFIKSNFSKTTFIIKSNIVFADFYVQNELCKINNNKNIAFSFAKLRKTNFAKLVINFFSFAKSHKTNS